LLNKLRTFQAETIVKVLYVELQRTPKGKREYNNLDIKTIFTAIQSDQYRLHTGKRDVMGTA
jgi:hypothetical protein